MTVRKSYIWYLALVAAVALAIYLLKFSAPYPFQRDLRHQPDFFGVTFSTKFCDELGLDWRETYAAVLDELSAKYIRIPVYWDEIEPTEGNYDFSKYDYLINEGERRGAKFIISLGRRVPRWPECHSPAWINLKDQPAIQEDALAMIKAVVERYRDRASVEYWQVENEPFLGTFGVCPPLDQNFLQREFDLVKSLDQRPTIITGSGEMSSWKREAKIGDIFGSTLYRVVYNSWFGYVRFPLPMIYYKLKARLAGLAPERTMIMELQTEPWVPQGKMIYLTADQINKSMSIEQFKANLQYAINLDFRRAYAWGVEWWYWQKKYGNPEYWRIAAGLFQ
ncbi:MAG: hypothetical protein WC453_04980 [Patescibacteria group bacterium]